MRLSQLAKIKPCELRKDAEFQSLGLLTHASHEQLVYLEDAKSLSVLARNGAISSVITSRELADKVPVSLGVLVSAEPKRAFYEIHNYLAAQTDFYGPPLDNKIAKSASIDPSAYVADRDVHIGERCRIGPKVCILEGTVIENDVTIGPGTVISSEGFQFVRFENELIPVTHAGRVLIRRHVELQANCCVDKSLFGGYTEIGENSKFDNLIHVAHNVKIGKRCLFAACAMIAGSATLGDDVWVGPSVSISSGITIGSGASLTLGSVVIRDVAANARVTGNFAIDHQKFLRFISSISR